jgi:hypothetical protein
MTRGEKELLTGIHALHREQIEKTRDRIKRRNEMNPLQDQRITKEG